MLEALHVLGCLLTFFLPVPPPSPSSCCGSIDVPRTGTFRLRVALEAQAAGAAGGRPPSADDGLVGGGLGGRRPGHRRLNRSRSANELDDMLRQAAELDALELAVQHSAHSRGASGRSGGATDPESPWRAATSSLAGGAAGASPASVTNGHGGTPQSGAPRLHALASAPTLSSVLIDGGGQAAGAAPRVPMLSTPGSAPRRPFSPDPPQGQAGGPLSPTFRAASQQDESEGAAAAREGGVPIRWVQCRAGAGGDMLAWRGGMLASVLVASCCPAACLSLLQRLP